MFEPEHRPPSPTPALPRPFLLLPAGAVLALLVVNVVIVTWVLRGPAAPGPGGGPGPLARAGGGRAVPATGRAIYRARCFWCHGEDGRGDGPSASGMVPRPRDFVRADYRIRSTPHGQLPTDEDLFRTIATGLPGTPMPGWKGVLNDREITLVVDYLKTLSPRFATEAVEPLAVPGGPASVEHGRAVYVRARCFMCHGDAGRGDGGITTALFYQWGIPHRARDFTRGWTFKGGHDPRDIYLRITGGLNGTPMGPFLGVLSDQDRWDLAHYVASLDREPAESSEDFVVRSSRIDGEIPSAFDDEAWGQARSITVPLGGQVVLDPPLRWWTPTTGAATIRSLRSAREIGFLLEWNDPTPPRDDYHDAAMLQFAAADGSRPYFLLGEPGAAVVVWRWQSGAATEEWTAEGVEKIALRPSGVKADATWEAGRWHVVFRHALPDAPSFAPGRFVPILLSVQDGANDELGSLAALSTWLYVTTDLPASARPLLAGAAWLLASCISEVWILARLRS